MKSSDFILSKVLGCNKSPSPRKADSKSRFFSSRFFKGQIKICNICLIKEWNIPSSTARSDEHLRTKNFVHDLKLSTHSSH